MAKKPLCPNCEYLRAVLTSLLDRLGGPKEGSGAMSPIPLKPGEKCGHCGGKGFYTRPGGSIGECPKCLGTGQGADPNAEVAAPTEKPKDEWSLDD